MDGLTIKSCGKGAVTYGPIGDYFATCGMSIVSGEDIMIVNCSFEDSVGTALGVSYSNLNLHGNNFTKNCNGHSSRSYGLVARLFTNTSTMFISENKVSNNSAEYGGGITPEKNIPNFTMSMSFRKCNSAKYGGGIYAYNSTLNLTGNNIFAENSAEYGGGISAFDMYSILNFTGDSSFTNNKAEFYGRGIHAANSTLISSGNNAFRDNSALYLGGAINADDSFLNFTGNNIFRVTQPTSEEGLVCIMSL